MKNEKWDDVHGNTTPDDRMVAFLESPTDSYAILQLREDVDDNIPLMFANYSYLQKKEMEPEIDRYEVVYHGSISMSEDVNRQLEDLYVKFNIDHPDDFRGHSMSVSDCCFSERMRKLFRKNEKNVLRFCNKKAKEKRRLQRVKKPM